MGTPLENMRKYHNYIKNLYIEKYITNPSNLLDLASGKGGDIHKWIKSPNVLSVDGYDIDSDSVQEALRRLSKAKSKKPINFSVLDLSKNILECPIKYDAITSHFAFHYFLRSPKTLNTILTSINNCSKPGTILTITALDGSLLTNIDTENYRINIIDSKHRNYGRKVEVFIKDSVLNKPTIEYMTLPEFLVKKLSEIDFELIDTKLFSELPYKRFKMTENEKDYSFLNRIYVFKKSKKST